MTAPRSLPDVTAFDAEWYLERYPDAAAAVAAGEMSSAEEHFRSVGAGQGYGPNLLFSESFYRRQYPEIAAAVATGKVKSGFDHFRACGQEEGRRPHALRLDENWYLAHYPEAGAALDTGRFHDVLDHYLREGTARRFSPHTAFDEPWYIESHPDAAAAVDAGYYLCGYQHFMEEGNAAGYQPHPLYSEHHYLGLHPDLAAEARAGRLGDVYLHLVHFGLAEGREWRYKPLSDLLSQASTTLATCRLDQVFADGRRIVLPAPKKPDVSIILVLYNRAELTLQCLDSLRLLEGVTFETLIVDNDSRDRTRDLLEQVDGARMILNDDNAGFVKACNQAAAAARGRHLLFLNNDTELWPTSLCSAVARLEGTPEAGAVGGRVINLDGRLQEAGSIVWADGATEGYGRGDDPRSGAYLFPREVDYCSGVFLLTPRELFARLGGFDEIFAPAYYEESDYCFRLRREGRKVIYDPGSMLLHHECASLQDPRDVNRFLKRNRPRFVERHGKALVNAYAPDVRHFFPAGNRKRYRGRVLLLDDHVPLQKLGGGSPRTQEILHTLTELGFFVTFFATNPLPSDQHAARREMPGDDLELIDHLGRPGFARFWQNRGDHYDVVVVCRPHNFRELLRGGFEPARIDARVIYDAEAVAARRRQLQLEVLGPEAPVEGDMSLDDEIALARAADEIWTVSTEEGELLAGPGQRFTVVSFGTTGEPGVRPFAERHGVLFVGRLQETWNPNVDALSWYLEEIHSRVIAKLGAEAALTVVGEPGDCELPVKDGVCYAGYVDDLDEFYDSHRVFVAPTRFAAGIPHKVTSTAVHGLPVVATSLLARQLGWNDGIELADGGDNDPVRFAERVVQVYTEEAFWRTLRQEALARAHREHGREALADALTRALEPSA